MAGPNDLKRAQSFLVNLAEALGVARDRVLAACRSRGPVTAQPRP